MPWSIFSDGGGKGAAVTWAQDLLQAIRAPETPGNQQFVYDWEVSEGGGGKYNPLNQGPVPGHPELTTTGSQYGGGAADFASWQAGITGAADYLAMPNFSKIAADLRANQPTQARADLIASPWASSHYGGGSAFASSPLPGQATALPGITGGAVPATDTGAWGDFGSGLWAGLFGGLPNPGGIGDPLGGVESTITGFSRTVQTAVIAVPVILGGAALVVIGLMKMTGTSHAAGQAAGTAAKGALLL